VSDSAGGESSCCAADGPDRPSVAKRIARSFDQQVGRRIKDPDVLPEPSSISARLLDLLSDVSGLHPSVLDLVVREPPPSVWPGTGPQR
jgi:hypothetical protein